MVLCLPACPAFIDGQGCLRESIDYKPDLVKSPNSLDTSGLHGGSHFDLIAPIEECFNKYMYTDATRNILGFDKYEDIAAKDNEWTWRASEVDIDYDLSIASHLNGCNYEKQIQQDKFDEFISPDEGLFERNM